MIDTTVTPEVQKVTSVYEYVQSLITQIETNGHYRGITNTPQELKDSGQAVCLVANKVPVDPDNFMVINDFRTAFAEAAGISYYELVEYNDSHSTEDAISSGSPIRPSGILATMRLTRASSSRIGATKGVLNCTGASAFTRTPLFAHSVTKAFVRICTAPLLAMSGFAPATGPIDSRLVETSIRGAGGLDVGIRHL